LLLVVQPFLRPADAEWQRQQDAASMQLRASEAPIKKAAPHVRVLDRRLQQILEHAADASPTLQTLIARLEDSDVVAYVECDLTLRSQVAGHLSFVSAAGGLRYVRIRVAHVGAPSRQAALIGHELRHAVEVAALPAIVDDASFAREYARIGFLNPAAGLDGVTSYETRNARLTGEQILRELRQETD
jgi:hypothetical protein